MQLTAAQHDALSEVINIAFSRTAVALADLTGHRVKLDLPDIRLLTLSDVAGTLGEHLQGEVASVHQLFRGAVSGDALLVLNCDGATALVDLLSDADDTARGLSLTDREVLTEIGNILLNACLGTFGNLLHVHISFTVPRLGLEDLSGLMASLTISEEMLRYALLVMTTFVVQDSKVTGYLVIVLGISSLERMLAATEEWGHRQSDTAK